MVIHSPDRNLKLTCAKFAHCFTTHFYHCLCLGEIYYGCALLQILIATQLLSSSACYKGANDNLCSSKCHTWSSLTLFFFLFFWRAHRFLPLGCMT